QRAPEVVLFDLDDTLFDHTYSSAAGLQALQSEFPALRRLPFEQLAKVYADNLESIHALVLAGEMSVDEARVARFRALLRDCGVSELDPHDLIDVYRDAYAASRRPVPGALDLLGALRARVRVGIVTNNVVAEQTEKLAHLGMTELVDAMVVSEEAGVRKPEAA